MYKLLYFSAVGLIFFSASKGAKLLKYAIEEENFYAFFKKIDSDFVLNKIDFEKLEKFYNKINKLG